VGPQYKCTSRDPIPIFILKAKNTKGQVSKFLISGTYGHSKTQPIVEEFGKSKYYEGNLRAASVQGQPKYYCGSKTKEHN
jgi:hypothetical protein